MKALVGVTADQGTNGPNGPRKAEAMGSYHFSGWNKNGYAAKYVACASYGLARELLAGLEVRRDEAFLSAREAIRVGAFDIRASAWAEDLGWAKNPRSGGFVKTNDSRMYAWPEFVKHKTYR